jgi:hypothetical protein
MWVPYFTCPLVYKLVSTPPHSGSSAYRWEPETACEPETVACEPETVACEPETVNRKGLQVTKSLEAGGREFERAVISLNALETQNRCLEALPPVK